MRWGKTVRSMAAEFGPPPAVAYPELANYDDLELIRRPTREVIAEIEAQRAERRRTSRPLVAA